jgi:hypothetical protein
MPTPKFFRRRLRDGFDEKAAPPWQMVPLGGTKEVRLLWGPNLAVVSTVPGVATVANSTAAYARSTRNIRYLTIRGRSHGTCFIEAKQGSAVKARLEVAVKRPKLVRLAFNFVKDTGGHRTRRATASVNQYVQTMNRIYTPQANIRFSVVQTRWVTVNRNLGTVVRFSSHLPGVAAGHHEWDHVVAKRYGAADFNFFFVWEYEQDATPGTDNTDAGALGPNCIFEDRAGVEIGETLAHEVGHFLGCRDYYANGDRSLLMYGYTDSRGRKISKFHANTMNP